MLIRSQDGKVLTDTSFGPIAIEEGVTGQGIIYQAMGDGSARIILGQYASCNRAVRCLNDIQDYSMNRSKYCMPIDRGGDSC